MRFGGTGSFRGRQCAADPQLLVMAHRRCVEQGFQPWRSTHCRRVQRGGGWLWRVAAFHRSLLRVDGVGAVCAISLRAVSVRKPASGSNV